MSRLVGGLGPNLGELLVSLESSSDSAINTVGKSPGWLQEEGVKGGREGIP